MTYNIKKSVFVVLAITAVIFFLYVGEHKKDFQESPRVCIGKNCFLVEIADSPSEWEKGLMGRNFLDAQKGMLFIFDNEDKYDFWMKNTLIPLDILWADVDGKIISINRNAKPCEKDPCELYKPSAKAKYVLEINAGLTQKYGIKTGNTMNISKE